MRSTENPLYYGVDISGLDPRLQTLLEKVGPQFGGSYGNNGIDVVAQFHAAPPGQSSRRPPVVVTPHRNNIGVLWEVTKVGRGRVYLNSTFGLTTTSTFEIHIGCTVTNASSYGRLLTAGAGGGFGLGIGTVDGDTAGNNFVGLREGVAWDPPTIGGAATIGTGFHTITILYSNFYGSCFYYMDGAFLSKTAPGTVAASPTNLFSINSGGRGSEQPDAGVQVHFVLAGRQANPGSYSTWDGMVAGLGTLFPPKGQPKLEFPSRRVSYFLAASVSQYLRPASDIAANGWLPSTGADLFAMLDETVADDADYIYSPDNPTTQQFEVKLSAASDPSASSGHVISIRLQAIGATTDFDLDLVQGSTVLDSWTENVTVADGVVLRTRTLTGTVADSITDYTDLRVRGVARA